MRTLRGVLLTLCAALFCATLAVGARAGEWDKETVVTFGGPVEIPGQVLPPGTYVFKLADSTSNRHIVQVWNRDETQLFATILAISDYRDDPAEASIINFEERPSYSPPALHS